MKKFAFTLIEVLLAMSVVGVIAAATINSVKNATANKSKLAFRNAYNHMRSTIDAITSDDTIYPFIRVTSGDGTTTSGESRYLTKRVSICTISQQTGLNVPATFRDMTKYTNSKSIVSNRGYAFETAGGIYWAIWKNPESNYCYGGKQSRHMQNQNYIVMFDINGPYEGTNCPYNITNPEAEGTNCSNPDTFKFGFGGDENILVNDDYKGGNPVNIYNGKTLSNYLKDNDYLQTK